MKHNLGLGTRLSIEADSNIYETCDYEDVLFCDENCDEDHDHYDEPYICVSRKITTCVPLSEVKHIFGPDHFGRPATYNDLRIT